MPYKLSATLSAHTSDVRAVSSPTDTLILSASRDTTAISWTRPSSSVPFTQAALLRAGSRFISAVTYIPPSADAPEGYAVTGGQDAIINIFSLAHVREDPSFSLIGHTQNVCALDATADGTIISGSWDQTAKVWKNFQLAYDLTGHEQSVWAVVAIDPEKFLTGSADNSIKLWQGQKNVRTFTGHTQAVRGLALVPDIGFASCSNDSEIRVWTLEGDLIYTLSDHISFVYSLSILPNGDLVSGGEDRTLRIWRDGECAQTIVHPAISVWAVSSMPNGDIVTGCSDGVVRVFSTSEERWASAEEIRKYDELVATSALPAQQVGDVKKSDLPGPEALAQPGKKPGEVKMVRNGELVEAHQWDSATMQWQKIGEVVDAVGSGRKQLHNGKEYDYVFDVDVQEGAPPLKLPYNANENPYSAAQRFLQNNELPLSFLDQVVRFIEQNTAGVNIGSGGAEYSDPFTGASRYRAAQNSQPSGGTEYMDPFTGASRYRSPAGSTSAPAPPPASLPSVGSDPWTGASRYSGATPAVPPPQPASPATTPGITLPVRNVLSFRQANVSAMQAKLYQFDQDLSNEISTSGLSMYHEELSFIEEAFLYLAQTVANISPITAPPLNHRHVEVIIALIERWPSGPRFPVMDLARLLIGYTPEAYADPALKQRFFMTLFQGAEWNEAWQAPLAKPRDTNVLLLLRALTNAFQETTSLGDGVWIREILEKLGEAPYAALSKTHHVTLATLLFNISCVTLRESLSPELRTLHLSLILSILQTEKADSETAYRALVSLGNILWAAKQSGSPVDASQQSTVKSVLDALPSTFSEERTRLMVNVIKGL